MKALFVVTSLLVSVVGTVPQDLSREQITAAIVQGRAGKTAMKKCGASGANGFDIVVEGPIGRIMRAANDAKRHHRLFTADTVTFDVSGPWLTVMARRDQTLTTAVDPMPPKPGSALWPDPQAEQLYSTSHVPRNSSGDYSYATDIALRSKVSGSAQPMTLRPARPILYTREASANYFWWTDGPISVGPTPGSDMIAWFDLTAFREMPPGDVNVVIFMTDAGERRCTMSEKDRRLLR